MRAAVLAAYKLGRRDEAEVMSERELRTALRLVTA